MSVNNNLWNDVDVRNHCFKRMQELSKEEPVNEVVSKRYFDDLLTAAKGTRVFTVLTCEMLKDRIRTKLGLLQELRGTNLESETPVYVTEVVRVAENFCNSHNQEGDVTGKTAETVGKKAEKVLKQLDETEKLLNMTMREQSVMAEAKALEQKMMEREKALLARESVLAAKKKALLTRVLKDEEGQLRSKIFDERDQFPVLRSEPRSSIFVSPTISERSDVGPPPLTDNDMIDPKKDDTQMAECLNELKSGKTFRNPTSCHTSVDNAVPVEIGTLSLAQTSISETVIDTDFPVDVLIGNPFRLAQLEGTTECDRQVPEKIDDTFYKDARSSMRKDIVIVADGGIGGDVSTSTVPSWHTTQAQQIEFSVEPGHPKCWMQSKDSWESSMPQYTGLQSASQASQYERPHQAESPSHSILQFRPEGFILPNPAKNPNRFPFERKLLEESTRRMFAAQQLEPSTSPVASRSHAIAKPVSFKQQDACIDRGKAPFKLDRFRIVVTHMPVNKAVQLMSFTGMSIAQALQIIGRHLWCRLLQQWTICQALPCTPDETFPPGRYNYLTTSKSFKATRDQGPSSSSKLLCYWGIELAI